MAGGDANVALEPVLPLCTPAYGHHFSAPRRPGNTMRVSSAVLQRRCFELIGERVLENTMARLHGDFFF